MFALLNLAILINHPVTVSPHTHYLIRILRSIEVDVHSLSQYSPPLLHIGVHHHQLLPIHEIQCVTLLRSLIAENRLTSVNLQLEYWVEEVQFAI